MSASKFRDKKVGAAEYLGIQPVGGSFEKGRCRVPLPVCIQSLQGQSSSITPMHRQPWVATAVHQHQASPAYIELAEQSGGGGSRMVETKVDLASKLMRTTSVSCTGEPQVRKLVHTVYVNLHSLFCRDLQWRL